MIVFNVFQNRNNFKDIYLNFYFQLINETYCKIYILKIIEKIHIAGDCKTQKCFRSRV